MPSIASLLGGLIPNLLGASLTRLTLYPPVKPQ
jgi:hypothetical protein